MSPRFVSAQTTTSLQPDATVLQQGSLRFRLLTSFTRFDELLGTPGSPRGLGTSLNVDSLGSAQLPILSSSESAIRAATGNSTFRLSAGQLTAAANSRIVTAPLIVEYGLSSRLTMGIVVPLVETRTSLVTKFNQVPTNVNVGPNPALTSSAVLAQNAAFVQSLTAAATTLSGQLTQCQATPSGAGCANLLAQQSTVQGLIQSSNALAKALAQLYGTNSTTPGQLFIPLASDPSQLAISNNIQSTRTLFKNFFNGVDPISGTINGANGPAAHFQLQSLLNALGHDTLQSADRSSIGDITVGASYQLMNTFPAATDSSVPAGRRYYRLSANVAYRIGTGEPADRNRFFDNSTGYGQPGVLAGLAADVSLGRRWSGSAVGSYTAQLGSVDINRVPNALNAVFPLGTAFAGTYSAGNVLSLSVVPRYRLSGYLALTGQYSLMHVGGDRYSVLVPTGPGDPGADVVGAPINPGLPSITAQQVGVGVTYATIVGTDRGPGRMPFEATFSHLETIAASGGPTPKTFRDQIELKLYFLR